MTTEVVTFGCRLNACESEVMRRHARAAGLGGEVVIVNTCAVPAEAVRQARQAIRKARRERPGARLVVTGCAAQIDPAAFAAMPEVDLVLGNAEKSAPGALAITTRQSVGDFRRQRNLVPSQARNAHVHGGGEGARARPARQHSRRGLDRQRRPSALGEQDVGDAAHAVAAGARLRAVAVEDAHERVGAGGARRIDRHQLVAGDRRRRRTDVRGADRARGGPHVDHQDLVAETIHFYVGMPR